MWYLYIFEDGSIKKGNIPPTIGDITMIGEGILTIIQCGDSDGPKEIDNTAGVIEIENVKVEGGFNV